MKKLCDALIVAAGNGKRMLCGGNINKVFLPLCDDPVISHTLTAFEKAKSIENVVVVTRECDIIDMKSLVEDYNFCKVRTIIAGGDTRQDSVRLGLDELGNASAYVAIHDGARCLVLPSQIDKCVAAAQEYGCAALGVPSTDSLKRVDENAFITATIPRDKVFNIQTPQVFETNAIKECHKNALAEGISVTDDCALAEHYGLRVKMVVGSYDNIKITTSLDLLVGESIINK